MNSNAFDEAIRKAIDLNVRYYSSVAQLAVDYWRELFATVTESVKPAVFPVRLATTQRGSAGAVPPAESRSKAALIMEAEVGSVAQGVFVVENHLNSDVDSAVVASPFRDSSGSAIQPAFVFDPPRLALKPNEQILVRVTVTIAQELEPDTRYVGEFMVPGLKGTTIPVVLRNRRK
jgi:hypothetical protein